MKVDLKSQGLLRITPCSATFCFITVLKQMAENSDSLKAPKSSFKQVHEIAQKLHIEVSYLFCKQCLQYKRMEVDPITQQKTGPIYCSIIFRNYYRDFIKIFTKKYCNNKMYSILILSDWCERLKCLINKKTLTNERA